MSDSIDGEGEWPDAIATGAIEPLLSRREACGDMDADEYGEWLIAAATPDPLESERRGRLLFEFNGSVQLCRRIAAAARAFVSVQAS